MPKTEQEQDERALALLERFVGAFERMAKALETMAEQGKPSDKPAEVK